MTRTPPARTARTSAGSSRAVSRSAPAETAVTRPCASTICTPAVPAPIGIGSGSRPLRASAATSLACWRAESSRERSTECRTTTSSSPAATASVMATTPVASRVSRAAQARAGPPASHLTGADHRDAPVTRRRRRAGSRRRGRSAARPAVRRVDLAPQVADVDLDDVGVDVLVLVPDVGEDLGLRVRPRPGVA